MAQCWASLGGGSEKRRKVYRKKNPTHASENPKVGKEGGEKKGPKKKHNPKVAQTKRRGTTRKETMLKTKKDATPSSWG